MRKKVISEVLLRTSKAPLSPQRAVPFPTHMPFPLSLGSWLLAPGSCSWQVSGAGAPGKGWGTHSAACCHRGQMGKLWPLGLWPPESVSGPLSKLPGCTGRGSVSVLAELGPLLLHFRFPGSPAIKMCSEKERLYLYLNINFPPYFSS